MGNINCIPRRPSDRERLISLFKPCTCYKRVDVIENGRTRRKRKTSPDIQSSAKDDTDTNVVDDIDETSQSLDSFSTANLPDSANRKHDETVNDTDTSIEITDYTTEVTEDIEPRTERERSIHEELRAGEEDCATYSEDDLHTTAEDALDDTYDGDDATQSSRSSSAASGGSCCFEDEITDPDDAGLMAHGLREVNLVTRDMLEFLMAVDIKPRVKAIDRIRSDSATTCWRSDPIPDEERRGSIEDLKWSRYMRDCGWGQIQGTSWESEVLQRQIEMRNADGSVPGMYASKGSRRFSKSTDVDEETDHPGKHHMTHSFMTQVDDTTEMERGGRDGGGGGGMIGRHTSYLHLPPIDEG